MAFANDPCAGVRQMTSNDDAAASSTFVSLDGDGYELQMGRWSRRLAPLFADFTGVTGAKRILDVGCGTGSLSFCLARNPEIVSVRGLDFSPAYIDHAKRLNSGPASAFKSATLAPCHFPTPRSTSRSQCSFCNSYRKPISPCVKCAASRVRAGRSPRPHGTRVEALFPFA
jgi:SAM-dependent methyltransferase